MHTGGYDNSRRIQTSRISDRLPCESFFHYLLSVYSLHRLQEKEKKRLKLRWFCHRFVTTLTLTDFKFCMEMNWSALAPLVCMADIKTMQGLEPLVA